MQSIFREYDIRGIFEKELNESTTKAIGFYLGLEVIKKVGKLVDGELFVSIGYDARTHSPILFHWLESGFLAAGCNVLDMGMVTTGVNYFTNFVPWDVDGKSIVPSASVMITGSHNPPEYNGFKITIDKQPFFGADITSLGQKIIASHGIPPKENGAATFKIDAKNRYVDYLVKDFECLKNIPTKVVADCGNGVAAIALKDILAKLNIDTKLMYEEPDGTFPNHHPDPSDEHNLEDIKKELTTGAFNIGFAFDGDADRIAVLTQKYNIKGDQLALIFAQDLASKGKKPVVIGEVKCSKVMYDEIDKIGQSIMYKTGHSNLKVKLRETGADFAAEVSGHMFFNDKWFGFDDAVYVALRVLELLYEEVDLDSKMDSQPKMFSTDENKVYVTEETKFPIIDKIKETLKNPPSYIPPITGIIDIDGVRVSFANGWGLIRASNTTPVLVTRFEADSHDALQTIQTAMNTLIDEAKK